MSLHATALRGYQAFNNNNKKLNAECYVLVGYYKLNLLKVIKYSRCHKSGVMCQEISSSSFFLPFLDKVAKLVGGGSVYKGAYPV